jgi:hypothetical protein
MTEYVAINDVLKLVATFKGERRDIFAFIANADTAFEVIDTGNATRINGDKKRNCSWELGKSGTIKGVSKEYIH